MPSSDPFQIRATNIDREVGMLTAQVDTLMQDGARREAKTEQLNHDVVELTKTVMGLTASVNQLVEELRSVKVSTDDYQTLKQRVIGLSIGLCLGSGAITGAVFTVLSRIWPT